VLSREKRLKKKTGGTNRRFCWWREKPITGRTHTSLGGDFGWGEKCKNLAFKKEKSTRETEKALSEKSYMPHQKSLNKTTILLKKI